MVEKGEGVYLRYIFAQLMGMRYQTALYALPAGAYGVPQVWRCGG